MILNESKFIRRKILVPVVLIFILLLVIAVLSLSWLQRKHINTSIARQDDTIQKLFLSYMAHDAQLMGNLLQLYGNNAGIVQAFSQRDRKKLADAYDRFYFRSRSEAQITHFAFLEPDGKVFFRSHKPDKYGDYLYHFSVKPEDARPGKTVAKTVVSIEGKLVLRVLYPLFRKGELQGYLAHAKRIDRITAEMKEVLDTDLVFLAGMDVVKNEQIQKRLARANAEDGQYRFKGYQFLASTLESLPRQFTAILDKSLQKYGNDTFTFSFADQVYVAKKTPLVNPDNSHIADVILLNNISEETASLRMLSGLLAGLSLVTGILLFFFFYRYTGGIQERLITVHNELQGEIEERKKAEEALQDINNTLAERVEERTRALKKSNAELQESSERFQVVMDSLDTLVYVADMETYEILFVNKYGSDIWGDVSGKICWQTLQGKQDGPCDFCTNDYLLSSDGKPGLTYVWEHQNQVTGDWFECRDRAISWKDGRIVRMEIATNINQRKRDESEKAALQEQLLQAQKMESIGRLAGGVAHDFNNILSAINGYAEICLLKMEDDSPYREELEIILGAGERAARLTQQLLAFSRKQIIRQELIDINAEIDDTYKMMERLLGEDVEIDISRGEELWLVKADRSQLEQVVINLAINARDAMPQGGKLSIETGNVTFDGNYLKEHYDITRGDYVMLAISDNGHGMEVNVKEHIFEPFFTTKGKGKGTGLGLAMVYGIVKQNQGQIQVYSEPGQGTVFKIYLPRAIEVPKKDVEKVSGENGIDNKGTETILLVEDDTVVREMSLTILGALGYTVLEAENGDDALQVCSHFHGVIDLLLTDVVMPKMNGPELAGKMRELSPGIKVLFMSGYTENAIVHHGVLEEGVDFIHKPITPQLLSREVRRILDR